MDVFACLDEPIVLQAGEAAAIPTGLAMEIPIGYEAQFRGRSGLAFKHAVFSFNGTIDADYRGEVKGLLINHSRVPFTIEPGMRIGQMIISYTYRTIPEFVEELDETVRADGGFGSTGFDVISENTVGLTLTQKPPYVGFVNQPSHVPYHESMGDNPPSNAEIMEQLLNAGKGK
jgi:dUTP pyrophosphatase